MTYGRYFATPLIALSIMTASGCPADDPGKPGKPSHPTVSLSNGSVLGPANYGIWFADNAKAACRWTVTMKGKIAASGGPHDAIISTPYGLKGGIVHTTGGCGKFTK